MTSQRIIRYVLVFSLTLFVFTSLLPDRTIASDEPAEFTIFYSGNVLGELDVCG